MLELEFHAPTLGSFRYVDSFIYLFIYSGWGWGESNNLPRTIIFKVHCKIHGNGLFIWLS